MPVRLARRALLRSAAAGTAITALGGVYLLAHDLTRSAQAETLRDGRPRLPPGQRVLRALRPMGGQPGDPRASAARLRIEGLVERPLDLSFAELLALEGVELPLDVHCVTGWSVLGARFRGVRLATLAARAGVLPAARHVIFEAAHGYTANVDLSAALAPETLVSWQLDGERLAAAHGGPLRAVVPSRYFWKSAKWLTGVRFVASDAPGYWERRGYHNTADPWREQRYA